VRGAGRKAGPYRDLAHLWFVHASNQE